ncbi:hypothetical protein LHYA1_G003001 [Lachnellula hyalina]|uniref:Uncharacterized protein n=1 Tax=Lachnellula hyalina TaxID=1316788 RepID=A0A8H8R441_9HELO|nr:uncharacterized protein LHYA1_G003001 [Lachnellula hyalina]TVY27350.1 hypothetical protein LHYA1_G003001 [Lachnellula hyalina]
MATLSTLAGWAALIAFTGAYWYYHSNSSKNRRLPAVKGANKQVESRNPKVKKPKQEGGLSSGDQEVKSGVKSQKKKTQVSKVEREVESIPRPQATKDDGRDDEIDNKEFARQLASLKTGTIMAPKSQATSKQKSVKQSRAQEKLPVETSSDNATAPSSANGGDADDDQSPLNSPELSATSMASAVTNGDVSDMLEKAAAGPSVLKITESSAPSRPKKAKPVTTFEAVETKKQRQNRKKAEAKKLAREEDEKERQVTLEQQRRTARIAEGRAAKDGSSFTATKAPTESAWIASPASGANGSKAANTSVDLLDTYEPSKTPAAPAPKKETTVPAEALYSEGELAGSDWQNNFSALPSEEEQTRLAMEESDNWKTVKAKERRKREKAAPTGPQSSGDERNDYGVPPVTAPSGPGKKWATTLVHVEPTGDVVEREKELQDSEWEVA